MSDQKLTLDDILYSKILQKHDNDYIFERVKHAYKLDDQKFTAVKFTLKALLQCPIMSKL